MATTVRNVVKRYRNYLRKHTIEDYVIDEFLLAEAYIEDLLRAGQLEPAVIETISLYEFLEEHRAVNPRTEYPGPGDAFKKLVDEMEMVRM